MKQKTIVVALGGNAITREFEEGNIHQQFANSRKSLQGVAEMIKSGYNVVIRHGNGPQVGNAFIRVEMARSTVSPIPLGVLVGDTEGGMGYMVEQCLMNVLHEKKVAGVKIATLVTQVLVDENDPSILNPTKYVGPFFKKEEVDDLVNIRKWTVKEDPGRGYRRVVPSPKPVRIVNREAIKLLLSQGYVVIAAGGGGIPVYIDHRGWYEGVDGVIDKDLASAVMANDIQAEILIILTAVDKVAIHFKKPNQVDLDRMTVAEAKKYLNEGHFPGGSMGPKIKAGIDFLEAGGEKVVITSIEKSDQALSGNAGTLMVK
ncbi:MAG: carbamate kinase [Desulfobacteraceae bacterium]|nr:MAG: carbamate kinase [Desulfobacteraceae bacterium]